MLCLKDKMNSFYQIKNIKYVLLFHIEIIKYKIEKNKNLNF